MNNESRIEHGTLEGAQSTMNRFQEAEIGIRNCGMMEWWGKEML
jgi:hypothetical protein